MAQIQNTIGNHFQANLVGSLDSSQVQRSFQRSVGNSYRSATKVPFLFPLHFSTLHCSPLWPLFYTPKFNAACFCSLLFQVSFISPAVFPGSPQLLSSSFALFSLRDSPHRGLPAPTCLSTCTSSPRSLNTNNNGEIYSQTLSLSDISCCSVPPC